MAWDTHANEGGASASAQLLSGLDGALANSKAGWANAGATPWWWSPPSSAAREDQRHEGTDHGTGTIALLAGGAVKAAG